MDSAATQPMLEPSRDESPTLSAADERGSSTPRKSSPGHLYGTTAGDAPRARDSLCAAVDGDDEDDGQRSRGTLAWTDSKGHTYYFRANPLRYSTPFILSQEMCERLAYYGLTPTLKSFLKHALGMTDSSASAYLGVFQGTMYVTPIASAIIADSFLGAYKTILLFSGLYMAGLVCLVFGAIDGLSQPWMVHVGMMVFITTGAGGIKSCVNVLGAQQFHPVAHKQQVTTFFTFFYASINIGALVGGLICPQVADSVSFFAAYLIPLGSFVLAVAVFVAGSSRYVKMLPTGSPVVSFARLLVAAAPQCSIHKCRISQGGCFDDQFVTDCMFVVRLLPLLSLVMPVMIAYNQMTTAFLTQGEKMHHVIFGQEFAPALMQNIDPIAVVITSVLVDGMLYPFLRERGQMLSVLTRYTIGTGIACCAVLCAFGVELMVKSGDLEAVSIWWQVPQFSLIAVAEVFVISTSYEIAFTYAPLSLKTVSSGCNLIFFAISGYISGGLFVVCESWMPDFNKADPSTYKNAHYDYYFLVLAGACAFGVLCCLAFRPVFATMSIYSAAPQDDGADGEAMEPAS
jgi:dipeptide/tripeptide permease